MLRAGKFHILHHPTHVITALVAVTRHAASFGIVIGHFRAGPRTSCGEDVLEIA